MAITFFECQQCKEHFRIGTDEYPKARKYCSRKCRDAAYYKRRVDNGLFKFTVYLSEEDAAKWEAIEDKVEWLHERLNELQLKVVPPVMFPNEMKPSMKFVGTEETPTAAYNSVVSQCLHYQPKGQCMVKGCKYGK